MAYQGQEKRKYLRLNSVFPVEFRLVELQPAADSAVRELSLWQQGFTSNVGKGGLCLEVNILDPQLAEQILQKAADIELVIHIPLRKKQVKAYANIAWVSKQAEGSYSIGLSYYSIASPDKKRIMNYAHFRAYAPRAALTFIIALLICFSVSSYLNYALIKTSKKLVEELVRLVQKSSMAKQEIKAIQSEKAQLQSRLNLVELKLNSAIEKIAQASKDREEARVLKQTVEELEKDKMFLNDSFIKLQNKENNITENLLMLTEKTVVLEKENLKAMRNWLNNHQNPRTGLISSFEGDRDIEGWAFTYDQALVAIIYSYFGDYHKAGKILDFYARRAKKSYGGFLNAYYADDCEVAEYIVHVGPNVWIGIAALQYWQMSRDKEYLSLAEDIARWLISLQKEDQDGGLRGGPQVSWFSTEHNLDAYAFLNMLYKVTNDEKYSQSAGSILSWLSKHAYDKPPVPVKRGKGDATIATDTYAWSIAAIGPDKLVELKMDPDEIMEFAKAKCEAWVEFVRPGGAKVRVKGFDFALGVNVGRGPVISTEWTAQMIVSYRIMARYYQEKGVSEKAKYYDRLANDFLTELTKLIITSPSRTGQGNGCLPYATLERSDTGHGWSTPRGNATGSVSGTSYALFAFNTFNPLQLEQRGTDPSVLLKAAPADNKGVIADSN